MRNSNSGNEQDFSVSSVIQHEDYAPLLIDNDISLLVLSSSVSYNDYMIPACNPSMSNGDDYASLDGLVSGWGTTTEGGRVNSFSCVFTTSVLVKYLLDI